MVYVADDGSVFNSEKECLEYEDKYKKRRNEREKRYQEVSDAYDNYVKLAKAFKKDYGDYYTFSDLFNELFS